MQKQMNLNLSETIENGAVAKTFHFSPRLALPYGYPLLMGYAFSAMIKHRLIN